MFPTFHISSFSTFHISIFSTFDIFLSFLHQVMMLDSQTGAWVEWHPMRTRRCRLIIFLFHFISLFLSALSFFASHISCQGWSCCRGGPERAARRRRSPRSKHFLEYNATMHVCLFQLNFCTGSVPLSCVYPLYRLRLGLANIIASECCSQLLLNILPKLFFSPGMGGPGGPGGFTFPAPPPPYSQ